MAEGRPFLLHHALQDLPQQEEPQVAVQTAPADRLDQETLALANAIAEQPPGQIADGKAMFHKHMEMDLAQAYAYATEFMAGAIQSEDARAGIDAFVNKKPKPKWTGR